MKSPQKNKEKQEMQLNVKLGGND